MAGLQKFGTLFKGNALGAITTVVNRMAGGLIRKQIDLNVMVNRKFQQIDHISIKGNGNRLFLMLMFAGDFEGFSRVIDDASDPPLLETGLNSGIVNFGDDAHAIGDFNGPRSRRAGAG